MKLPEYIQQLPEKSLLLVCEDCRSLNHLIPNRQFLLYNTFTNLILRPGAIDVFNIKRLISTGKVEHLVLVNHYCCENLNYIANDEMGKQLWSDTYEQLKYLKFNFGSFSLDNHKSRKLILTYYTAIQLHKLKVSSTFKELFKNKQIDLSAILIDETNNEDVQIIEGSIARPLLAVLN